MKNNYPFKSSLTAVLLALGSTSLMAQDAIYHGNSNWENKSPYLPIVEETFQDWNYTDEEGYGLKKPEENSCAANARSFYENYSTFEVKRAVDARQNKPNGKLTFFLDFCQIQPDCDTQSGTNYALNPEAEGTNNDNKGPSWTNVSVGCISIYDNYQDVRSKELGVAGDGAGSFTTSLIPLLERIQYTTSSYGNKRGFHLEVGYLLEDNTIYWDTLKYLTGNLATTRPASFVDEVTPEFNNNYFMESNRGYVFEELFGSGVENVFIRIRPTNASHNRQIVRVHDLRLYGTAPETDEAINPNLLPTSLKQTSAGTPLGIIGYDGHYKVTRTADVQVYDVAGKLIAQHKQVNTFDLSASPKGLYIVRAFDPLTGARTTKKILR